MNLISLKWFVGQLNFYLLHTSQGRLIMLAAIIIALLVIDRGDEKN